jgi:hypothetical protein
VQNFDEELSSTISKIKYCIEINKEATSAKDCRYLSCTGPIVGLLVSQLVAWCLVLIWLYRWKPLSLFSRHGAWFKPRRIAIHDQNQSTLGVVEFYLKGAVGSFKRLHYAPSAPFHFDVGLYEGQSQHKPGDGPLQRRAHLELRHKPIQRPVQSSPFSQRL